MRAHVGTDRFLRRHIVSRPENPGERRFTDAIVRLPGDDFAAGLTRVELGVPSLSLAREQHHRYCEALAQCGLNLTVLPAEADHPDGTFVEDTAVVVAGAVMLTRPGAPSRRGEVATIRSALRSRCTALSAIVAPATLDGGDVCEAGEHVFVGISDRTDAEGATQLGDWLQTRGYRCTAIDIRGMHSILHLKSGIAALGDGRLLVIDELAAHPAFAEFDLVRVDVAEEYAANAVRINDHVLVASGYPIVTARLEQLGYRTLVLDMSEFAKLDGGLSCLSLRI